MFWSTFTANDGNFIQLIGLSVGIIQPDMSATDVVDRILLAFNCGFPIVFGDVMSHRLFPRLALYSFYFSLSNYDSLLVFRTGYLCLW